MEKLNVKLMAFDLDDTLLTSERTISDKTVSVLKKCVEKGIYIVLCSGRPEGGIFPFVERLGLKDCEYGKYIAAINGCSIYDVQKNKKVYAQNVDADLLLEVDRLAEEAGLKSEVYAPDVVYFAEVNEWTMKDPILCGIKGEAVADYRKFLAEGEFPKMLIPGEPEKLIELQKKIKAELGDRINAFTSKPYFLEILRPDCGKGISMNWLADYVGISRDTVMAFGDGMNDENMIRLCNYGVAMQNANPLLKECADFITDLDNDHDGVADFIEKYVL